MKPNPYKIAALAGAFGVAALTSACIRTAGEGGEGGRAVRAVTLDPGGLIYQPPTLRVDGGGHGGEGGEGK